MQFKVLETTFKENPKPNASTRKQLSQELEMSVRAVQIWFQNRRAKAKSVARKENHRTQNDGGGYQRGDTSRREGDHVDDEEEDDDDDDSQQNIKWGEMKSQGHRDEDERSSSLSSSIRSRPAGQEYLAQRASTLGAAPLSFDTFKIPVRPPKVETDSFSSMAGRKMSPSTNAFANSSDSAFHQSAPLCVPSRQLNTSYYEGYPRHTSSSLPSASYDDRFRRDGVESPIMDHHPVHQVAPSFPPFDVTRHGPSSTHGLVYQTESHQSSSLESTPIGQDNRDRELANSNGVHHSLQAPSHTAQSNEGYPSSYWRG
jgi:hypothetical protein